MDTKTINNWSKYLPPDQTIWHGRSNGQQALRFHEIVKCIDLRQDKLNINDAEAFALIGFACDEGIKRNQGRPGASHGPAAFRKALANFPFPVTKNTQIYDVGNIICLDGDLEASQSALSEILESLFRQGVHPVLIGGGHEIAWGHYQGIINAHPKLDLAIVNIDAHLDLRPLQDGNKGTSGTSFLQIAEECRLNKRPFNYTCIGLQSLATTPNLYLQAENLKANIVHAEEIHLQGLNHCLFVLDELIRQHEAIYLTICLDVFAAPVAPGVSAPQPLGLYPWHVTAILRHLIASGKVISFDIAELSPAFDQNGVTANLAADLAATFLTRYDWQD